MTTLPALYAPVRKTRNMCRKTTATIKCAQIRCSRRSSQPKLTANSRSLIDQYARSTEGTYRNISTTPVTVRIMNRTNEIVPR